MRNITFYTSQVEFLKTLNDFLCSGKEETEITVMDKTEAFYGDEGTCDTKYCVEHGIPYSHNGNFAGTGCIIAVKGNVIVDVTRKSNGGESLSDKFAKVLCEYFKNKGLLSVRCDNNDVLVDNFKVASGAEISLPNGYRYMGFQISIHQDIETIKKVCKKPMLKVPKALSEYGVTTDEMVYFCIDYWLKN